MRYLDGVEAVMVGAVLLAFSGQAILPILMEDYLRVAKRLCEKLAVGVLARQEVQSHE